MRQVVLHAGTASPKFDPKNRVGRPRVHRTVKCYSQVEKDVLRRPGAYRFGQADVEDTVLEAALQWTLQWLLWRCGRLLRAWGVGGGEGGLRRRPVSIGLGGEVVYSVLFADCRQGASRWSSQALRVQSAPLGPLRCIGVGIEQMGAFLRRVFRAQPRSAQLGFGPTNFGLCSANVGLRSNTFRAMSERLKIGSTMLRLWSVNLLGGVSGGLLWFLVGGVTMVPPVRSSGICPRVGAHRSPRVDRISTLGGVRGAGISGLSCCRPRVIASFGSNWMFDTFSAHPCSLVIPSAIRVRRPHCHPPTPGRTLMTRCERSGNLAPELLTRSRRCMAHAATCRLAAP